MSNNNVLDAALSIIVACHTKRKKLPHKTKKSLLSTTFKSVFLLPINGVSSLFYPT